jgi:thioesterase domain-containing protein
MADGSNANYAWSHAAARLLGGKGPAEHLRYLGWLNRVHFLNGMRRKYLVSIRDWLDQPTREQLRRLGQKTRQILQRIGISTGLQPAPTPPPIVPQPAVAASYARAFAAYVPRKYDGTVVLLWPMDEASPTPGGPAAGWAGVCREVQMIKVPGQHHSCVSCHDHLVVIGNHLREALQRAEAAQPATATRLQPAIS